MNQQKMVDIIKSIGRFSGRPIPSNQLEFAFAGPPVLSRQEELASMIGPVIRNVLLNAGTSSLIYDSMDTCDYKGLPSLPVVIVMGRRNQPEFSFMRAIYERMWQGYPIRLEYEDATA
jgi:hypothetical protein